MGASQWFLGAACLTIAATPSTTWAQEPAQQQEATAEASATETSTQTAAPAEETAPVETPVETAPVESPAEPEPEKAKSEDIYVTGSRIKRIDLATPAPVTVLTRQDLDASGKMAIGEILQQLPAQSNAINIQTNNGGDGSTRVNLRGVGTARTLVLVNGRRFVAGGTGADSSVDLNSIPAEIIERVEVLKDGASAIYGSDAVAGVVNIITKKDFAGVELNAYTGGTSNGGFLYTLGVTGGERGEKGGFLLNFQWYDQSDVFAGQRDYSNTDRDFDYDCRDQVAAGMATDEDCPAVYPLGSSAIPGGYFRQYSGDDPGNTVWRNIQNANGDPAGLIIRNDPANGFARFVAPGDTYNYQPENYLLTPSQRVSLWGQGDYEISKRIRSYFEASYTNRRSEQLLAPEPLFTVTEGLAVTADNVYNPFGRDFFDVRRRLVEFGNRLFTNDVDTFRAVVGLDGTFTDSGFFETWAWDANFVYGRTVSSDQKAGLLWRSRLAAAIGPSFVDETGTARCGSPDAPIDGCVPINLFGGPSSITPEMTRGLTYTGTAKGYSDQRVFNLGVSGELFKLWKRPVGVAVGYMFRREEGGQQPDPLTAAGDTTGNKGEPTAGGFTENAGYIELNVPVLADLPAVQLLEANAALRVFDFDTFGGDMTYKLGGRWQLFEHAALRGTFSKAFRAPSVAELFAGQADNFPDAIDPCAVESGLREPNNTVDQNCDADGIPDDHSDDRVQLRERVGGNPALGPEEADTITAGLVITPKGHKLLDGLSLTVDYFSIEVTNAISVIGADVILTNCYANPTRANCDFVQRDAQGMVQNIIDLNTNIGGVQTTGVDFGLLYNVPSDFGTFRLNFDGVILGKYDEIQPARTVEGKGVYDLTAVFPSLRFNVGLGWGWKGATAGFSARYIGGIKECEGNDCSATARTAFDEAKAAGDIESYRVFPERDVDANVTFDLYAGYAFSNPLGFTSIQAGINNLFDQAPPVIYQGFLADSDADNYDYIGRFFYIGVRQSL